MGEESKLTHFVERRKHQRCSNLICKVYMSTNQRQWDEVTLCDISAGGLKFATKTMLPKGACLYFNLHIYNMLSEFTIHVEGRIVRTEKHGSGYAYGVQFQNFSKHLQIQLDELIKSRISANIAHHSALQDAAYAMEITPYKNLLYKRRSYLQKDN